MVFPALAEFPQNTIPKIQTPLQADDSGEPVEIHPAHYEAAVAGEYYDHFYIMKQGERIVVRVSRGPWREINYPANDGES